MSGCSEMVDEVYALTRLIPRLNHRTPSGQLPENGVYLFFQRGEAIRRQDMLIDRVVRVGTHRRDGRFRSRIHQHFTGNKNGSVFRKHLGGALMRRANPQDARLGDWLTQDGPSFAEVEEMVSRELRENFTFSCFRVDRQGQRLALERGLIALLAQHPPGQPSPDWLGRYAASEEIRRSGLWNTQHIGAEPLAREEFHQLKQLVKAAV